MDTDFKRKYQRYDWEAIVFPLTLTNIQSITHHYDIPIDSVLKVWRDDEYRLRGLLEGVTDDKDVLEYKENQRVKKVGFIDGETLNAKFNDNDYLIEGFGLKNISIYPVQSDEKLRFGFCCETYLESIQLLNKSATKPEIICEWYLCSMPEIFFSHTTLRYLSHPNFKIRRDIDTLIENESEYIRRGYSSSWDFAVVNYKSYKIILQQVSNDYLPKETDGIVIEYRADDSIFPSPEFKKIFSEYISFILGNHIQQIGTSEFKNGYELISSQSQNPWKGKIKKNSIINPIPLKNGGDRDFFENQLNKLLGHFISLHEKTSLSDCLWKLWIGCDLSIGTNLPIIASGFEMLINSFLERNNLIRKYTKKEKHDYRQMVTEEIESLRAKLTPYDFAPFVLNKLENPFNFGIGEKFKIFFKNISLEFESNSLESKALRARNLMIHVGFDFSTIERQKEIKKLSDAYITLVNRVILRLLDYDGYYVDYSKEGIRYLKMNENM